VSEKAGRAWVAGPLAMGVALLVVGLVLYLTTEAVHTPVFTLTKVGLVLIVVGGIDIVVVLARLVSGRRTGPTENS
jgi:hypothetical protein